MFLFRYYKDFTSPLYPLLRAIIACAFEDRQGECYKIVTGHFSAFPYPNISINSENVSATLYVTGAKSPDSSWLHTQTDGFSLLFL